MRLELVLIRGLPGSGKTTMAKVMAAQGYDHHEADQYFERGGTYRYVPKEVPKAHAWCLARVRESLRRGRPCVVANTFSRRIEMERYIQTAKQFGVPVRIIEARGNYPNVHGVPPEAIERMRARWEEVIAPE
jgi:predicted kinase